MCIIMKIWFLKKRKIDFKKDFNASIGNVSHENNPRTVRTACYYEITKANGQWMIDLCKATDLGISHSHFLNRKTWLYTYVSPKGDQQQLDHILISSKWWKLITNCSAYNTIEIGSDNRLVFHLSLRANKQASDVRC